MSFYFIPVPRCGVVLSFDLRLTAFIVSHSLETQAILWKAFLPSFWDMHKHIFINMFKLLLPFVYSQCPFSLTGAWIKTESSCRSTLKHRATTQRLSNSKCPYKKCIFSELSGTRLRRGEKCLTWFSCWFVFRSLADTTSALFRKINQSSTMSDFFVIVGNVSLSHSPYFTSCTRSSFSSDQVTQRLSFYNFSDFLRSLTKTSFDQPCPQKFLPWKSFMLICTGECIYRTHYRPSPPQGRDEAASDGSPMRWTKSPIAAR